jgi:hypothetical protein
MASTNQDRVGKALDLLKQGVAPFVERELKAQHGHRWFQALRAAAPPRQPALVETPDKPKWDIALVLKVMWEQWDGVFRKTLGRTERTLVAELRDVRNRWRTRSRSRPTTPIALSTLPGACSPRSRRPRPPTSTS